MSNLLVLLVILIFVLVIIHTIAFLILAERKLLAVTQRRVGPAILGRRGFLQIIADVVKPLFKELFEHKFQTVTLIAFGIFLLFLTQIIYATLFQVGVGSVTYDNIEFVLFIQLFFGGFSCFAVLLIGYLSGTKYGVFGSVRLIIAELSSETATAIVNSVIYFTTAALDYESIACAQLYFNNISVVGFIYATSHIIYMFVSAQRSPIDLIENEGELVAGYNIEYSGPDVLVIYFAEYLHLFNAGLQFIFLMFGCTALFFFNNSDLLQLYDILPQNRMKIFFTVKLHYDSITLV